jgi:hypothetical protein
MNGPEVRKLFQEGSTFKALKLLTDAGRVYFKPNFKELIAASEGKWLIDILK